jgi:Domain of unknown function (DUF1841)
LRKPLKNQIRRQLLQGTANTAEHRWLCLRHGNEHEAQHRIMECLAEKIWQAGRNGTAPDPSIYLVCLKKASN